MKRLIKLIILSMMLFTSSIHASFYPFDADIETGIEGSIAIDESISDADIVVYSHNGFVSLIGQVSSQAEADRIIDLAQSTAGVVYVDASQLTVRP